MVTFDLSLTQSQAGGLGDDRENTVHFAGVEVRQEGMANTQRMKSRKSQG